MQNADDSVETVIVVSEKNNGEDSEEPVILDLTLHGPVEGEGLKGDIFIHSATI